MNKRSKSIIAIAAVVSVVIVIIPVKNKNTKAYKNNTNDADDALPPELPTQWEYFDFVAPYNNANGENMSAINSVTPCPSWLKDGSEIEIVVQNGDKKYNGIHSIMLPKLGECGCVKDANKMLINIAKQKTASGKYRIIKA